MTENIILGSGELFIAAFDTAIPADATLEVDANNVGYIKGGASIEYKPTEYEVKDDSGSLVKRFIIAEEVTFKSGIMTWDLAALQKLCTAGSYTDATGVRTLKLGGKGAKEMTQYVVRFVHTNADAKKFRVTLVGTASNGFSLAFAADKETVVDATFKAVGHDANGTQLILAEEYEAEIG